MFAGSIFDGFYDVFGSILAWFYSWAPNIGLDIVLLTIAVMVVITPLTLKSTRSMLQMQRLQPELKKIQDKYKGDRERLNAEMMAFYREHQINPISGCVPLLAQTPVFLLMYRVIRGITTRDGGAASGIGHVVGQYLVGKSSGATVPWPKNFTAWQLTNQPFAPEHVAKSSAMYKALAQTTKMSFLGMDLSISPKSAISLGATVAFSSLVMMALMVGSQIIQNRQIQGRTQNTPVNSQQQIMMKVLPFMLPVISFFYPAGLGLYYFVQGLARIGTQAYITRTFYGDNAPQPITVSSTEVADKAASNGAKPASGAKKAAPPAIDRKPGSSTKSQAAQKKKAGGGTSSGGRRSGDPRSGRSR